MKANLQLLKQIKAHSPYMITSKITIMMKIKMFKSESVHVDHSIKPEPCLGRESLWQLLFSSWCFFYNSSYFQTFFPCVAPLFPRHLLLSTILQPQAQTPLPYTGKESSLHVRLPLAHTPRGDKWNQNTWISTRLKALPEAFCKIHHTHLFSSPSADQQNPSSSRIEGGEKRA